MLWTWLLGQVDVLGVMHRRGRCAGVLPVLPNDDTYAAIVLFFANTSES